MQFSIIVPVYNVQSYLRECVDSILSQTFTDYELILVDDGSTDKSGEICDEYRQHHHQIQVIHQKNAGLACARNAGTAIAQGKYIIYLDSDDYYVTNCFLDLLAEKTKENADVIFWGYKKFYESDKTFGAECCNYSAIDFTVSPGKVLKSLLENDLYDGSAWTKSVKRAFVEAHGIRFRPGIISEDTDWFLQIISHAERYDAISCCAVIYRQRNGSITHALKIKSLTDNIDTLERWGEVIEGTTYPEDERLSLLAVLARYVGNLIILYSFFPLSICRPYRLRVKRLCRFLKFSITKRSKIVCSIYRILGLTMCVYILKIISKLTKRA